MLQNKVRWVYLMAVMDTSLIDILLQSCKYVIFDPQETILEVRRMKLDKDAADFMVDRMLTEQFSEIIREKKNRHIIYACRKIEPQVVLSYIETVAKEVSPTSKFYYSLISDDENHLKLKDFYSIYAQQKAS